MPRAFVFFGFSGFFVLVGIGSGDSENSDGSDGSDGSGTVSLRFGGMTIYGWMV
jgi:hypothetical protein